MTLPEYQGILHGSLASVSYEYKHSFFLTKHEQVIVLLNYKHFSGKNGII